MEHTPVLLDEIIEYARQAEKKDLIVDCTLGLGGYSERFLKEFHQAIVIGLDVDPFAQNMAKERLSRYGERFSARLMNFRDIEELKNSGKMVPDLVVFDLGVSNLQLTSADRGFSYNEEGPLDMRMGRDSDKVTAWDVINTFDAPEMSDIFRIYGEERHAWQIAKGIVRYRQKEGTIDSTTSLVQVLRQILPAPVQRKMGKHPARRIFQALRIFVNDELESLEKGLEGAFVIVAEKGSIIIVSYHSLEDRIVKHTFKRWKMEGLGQIITKKPVVPSDEEIENNIKARSAKMRIFKKETIFR
jgi:16S rRNA (cytosine1402-N4)-methyltransferase